MFNYSQYPFQLPPLGTPPINPVPQQQQQQPPMNMNERLTGLLGNPMFRVGLALLGTKERENAINNALGGLQGASQHQQQMSLMEMRKAAEERARQQAEMQRKKFELETTPYQDVSNEELGLPPGYIAQRGPLGKLHVAGSSATGTTPATLQEWAAFQNMNPTQKRQYLEMKRAPYMVAGTPYVGGQPIVNPGDVRGMEAAQGYAKESGKLGAQAAMKPEVEGAVKAAQLAATDRANMASESRSNAKALNVFQTGLNQLTQALGRTETGPIMGRLPAWTADQQTAEGMVAIMGPLLKDVFRSAGEGTFTDKDQELLLGMIPTRTDRPETRQRKLQAIAEIVSRKLGNDPAPVTGGGEKTVNWNELPK